MKIKAITPMGTFLSMELHLTDIQRHRLEETFTTKMKDLKFFNFVTDEGPTYLGTDVIQNSVFVLLD
jgi:hypothetical protein